MAGNSLAQNVVDQTALLTNNVSFIFKEIYDDNVSFIGETPLVKYEEHLPVNGFTIDPENNKTPQWGKDLTFELPKNRLVMRKIWIDVTFPPGTLNRPLVHGEYVRLSSWAPILAFQEKLNALLHGGNTRLLQRFPFTADIVKNFIDLHPMQREQWESNVGGGSYWNANRREAAFYSGYKFSIPLTQIYWDQEKHANTFPFIPNAFGSKFVISLPLSDKSYCVQTNITYADYNLNPPTVQLTFDQEELGPEKFYSLRKSYYWNKKQTNLHFVHHDVIGPTPIPNGVNNFSIDLSQVTNKDIRRFNFFIAPPNHAHGNALPFTNGIATNPIDSFNFDNCWKINSFYFSIKNNQATVIQTDSENKTKQRQKTNKANLSNGNIYTYKVAEYAQFYNICSGAVNIGSKKGFTLNFNFDAIPNGYNLYLYLETENIISQANNDLTPIIAL